MAEKTGNPTRPRLPDFRTPPVAEVALSLQFDPLHLLRTPHLGLLWEQYRESFPKFEEQAPLPPAVEWFGLPTSGVFAPQVELLTAPLMPRCLFISERGSELVQVQQDRFVFNWRKLKEDDSYPRYEYVRAGFEKQLQVFQEFMAKENIGDLAPNQCEVTYVNQLLSGHGWEHPGQLDKLVTVWRNEYSDQFLMEPEDVRLAMRYVIRDGDKPIGRLHVNIEPRFSTIHRLPVIVITLTARGAPPTKDLAGVFDFFDIGRKWIVSAFASITTNEMHRNWGRLDEC
ncbi:MAG: TIGR04255 family protein [Terriglobales bacterium]